MQGASNPGDCGRHTPANRVAAAAARAGVLSVLVVTLHLFASAARAAERFAPAPKNIAVTVTQTGPSRVGEPLVLRSKASAYDVKVTLPPEAVSEPKVLMPVAGDAVGWLADLTVQATGDERESGTKKWWRPYSGELAFKPAFVSDGVVSLLGEWWQDTGGAHPNSGFMAENIDPKTGAAIDWTDLVPAAKGGPAFPGALLQYVHDNLMRQKRERMGDGFDAKMAEDFMQDLGQDAPIFTFAPSATKGRAGGLTLHFPPYAVGAYVEGPYTVDLPVSVFADQLAPAWRDAFVSAKP